MSVLCIIKNARRTLLNGTVMADTASWFYSISEVLGGTETVLFII